MSPAIARAARTDLPPPRLISTTAELAALCNDLREEEFVTVDSEFMRERTYWPELCVVQLGGTRDTAVVDVLAPDLDLAPLGRLMADRAVTKVFHAARQDIEILVLRFGEIPTPLFDTQVAAMVAGFGDQVAYDTLVGSLAGGQIDKTHRFTDWSARPLSPAQLAYAAADVTYLRTVYQKLRARLEQDGRLDWVAEEMSVLTDPATYQINPDDMWLRLRPRSTNRRYLGMVRALASWREREAQRVNIPRQRLLRDEALLEIAATMPETPEALERTRGVSRGFAEGRLGASLIDAVATGKAQPEEALPPAPRPHESDRASPALVALLKVLLAAKCEQHHVAPRLVASADDIHHLALGDRADLPALQGWRREVFGHDAIELCQGRLGLGVDGRRVKLIH